MSIFYRKWLSTMIFKACYKPRTIFLSLPVKDSLYRHLWNSWIHCRSKKGKIFARTIYSFSGNPLLHYLFSQKHEFYSKPPKMFEISKITLEKRSNGLDNLVHHNLSRGENRKVTSNCSVPRRHRNEVGSIMIIRLVVIKTMGTKFVFDFCAILALHVIYQKCLSLLTNF